MKKKLIALALFILCKSITYAQCGNIITVDLSGSASGSFTSGNITRNEKCCTSTSNDCIQFSVTLNSNAIGLLFNLVDGALPSGALFYTINCGPEIPINNIICLSGGQTYQVTFCKPGNNANKYQIISIPGLEIPDLTVKQGCSNVFDTKLPTDNGNITWTSSTPGATSYLSCVICSNPTFTPTSTTPENLSYFATWTSSTTVCGSALSSTKEVLVNTLPKPVISVSPVTKVFCQNGSNASRTLTATVTGPGSNYKFEWYNSNNPSFVQSYASTFVPPADGSTTNYTVKVTDINDNCSFQTFSFPVTYNPIPTFSIDNVIGCKNDSVTFSVPGNFTYSFSPSTGIVSLGNGVYKLINTGNQTYTITATNGFGCQFIDTFNLTVKECTTCPPNVIKCSALSYPPFTTITSFISAGGAVNFPCTYANSNITLLSEKQTGTDCNGLLERNYEIFDDCGNSAICKHLITLKDTTPPNFLVFPGNYTAQCPLIPPPVTPTFSDNCDTAPTITMVSNITTGTCASQKTVTYTWTIKDKCGNTNVRTQTIQIVDTQAPVFSNTPANVTVSCGDIPVRQDPIVTDNCSSLAEISVTYLEEVIPGNCLNNKTLKRTWTAKDLCNNQTVYIQTITVKDVTAPTFSSLPADINVSCTNIPANPILTVTDSCDLNPSLTFTSIQLPGTCPNEYTIQNTWVTKDACLNERTHIQKINVSDKEKPSFVFFPADQTVDCHNIPLAATPTYTDNCSTVTIAFNETKTNGSCLGSSTILRTWTITDACTNSFSKTQTIQVVDTKAPVLQGVPGNVSVLCNAIPTVPTVTATDLCDPAPKITFTETKSTGCLGSYNITRTWKAIDACNNQQTLIQVITVNDNEKPVFSSLPNSLSTSCNAIPAIPALTATDNCTANIQVQFQEQKIAGSCPDNYILKRTWTATDSCGNSAIHIQQVNVSDTEAPKIANSPSDLVVSCENLPNLITLNVSDNCDLNPSVSIKEDTIPGICPNNYSLIRTWKVKDVCQNETTLTQKIVVKDEVSPIFLTNPADLSVSCKDNPPLPAISIKDNCDLSPTLTLFIDTIKGLCLGNFQVKRTWIAIDNCFNESQYIQRINFSDNTAPTFVNLPGSLTVTCNNVPTNPTVQAIDDCDPNPMVKFSDAKSAGCSGFYTITRTWTAVDVCLNTTTFVQTINVTDSEPPVFTNIPQNITVSCSSIPGVSALSAIDNCDINPAITFTEDKGVLCAGNYLITRKWKAKDACGNESQVTQVITVEDNEAPKFINPPGNLVIDCNATAPNWTPQFTDNCDASPTVTFTSTTKPGGCTQNYTIERSWIVKDKCGNQNTHTQLIQVKDDVAPQINGVPASVQVSCNAVPAPPSLSAMDNCDPSPTITMNDSIVNGSCTGNYTIFRIWKAQDQCGNAITSTQQITVIDNVPPVFSSFPSDQTSTCQLIPIVINPIISDICDSGPTITFSELKIPGNCTNTYTIQRTWIASDKCGNTNIKTQNIQIKDEENPKILNLPANVTVNCDQIPLAPVLQVSDNCDLNPNIQFTETKEPNCVGNYKIERVWVVKDACNNTETGKQTITAVDNIAPVFSGIPADAIINCGEIPALPTVSASDNCSISLGAIQFTENQIVGICPFTNVINRSWEVTDHCGNIAKATQKISLKDDVPPVVSNVPSDITVNCNEIPAKIDPTIKDNCDLNPVLTYLETKIAGSCPQTYTLERKWTATDKCGNFTTVKQIINVQDVTAPVFSNAPSNLKVSCSNVPSAASPTLLDICDPNPTLTFKEEKLAGSCPNNYNLIRTWTAEDACKNNLSISQTVEVTDNEAPIIVGIPVDQTVSCDAIPMKPTVSISDLCDLNPLLTYTESITQGSCPNNGVISRTWKAIDACGNTLEKTQKITLQDIESPIFINAPSAITVNCDLVPPVTNPQLKDNCDINPTLVFLETIDANCQGNYKIIRKWTATDQCNNSRVHEQIITVTDNIPPVIVGVPTDVTVKCTEIPAIITLTVTDNCDNAPTLTFNEEKVQGNCANNYVLLRKWTSIDKCGNKTEKTQRITIEDNEKPVFTNNPLDLNLSCEDAITDFIPVATDNCLGTVTITKVENKVIGSCPQNYLLEKQWTATDSSVIIQKINVSDKVAPKWNYILGDTTINCIEASVPVVLTATDNCNLAVVVKYNELKIPGSCSNNYKLIRTWDASDGCGNDISQKQTIQVEDNILPTLTNPGADQIFNCRQAIPPMTSLTWTDNCSGTGSIPGIDFSDGKTEPEIITRTWEYKDPCGNGVVKTQKFTINSLKGTLTANLPLCIGNELTLTATGGDSYTWSGPNGFASTGAIVKIPNTNASNAGNYTVQVKDLNGCNQSLSKSIDFLPNNSKNLEVNLCTGKSFSINGKTYSSAGQFTEIIKNGASNGCDSIVNLTINLLQSFTTNISSTICPGQSYSFFGKTLTTTGNYAETLIGATVGGCDSTINLTLTVNAQVVKNITETICSGQKYTVGTNEYSSSGSYEINFPGAAVGGCDSLVKLNLTVKPNNTANIIQTICAGESFTAGNQSYSTSGNYSQKLIGGAKNGCDSTINLSLTVLPQKSETTSAAICEGQLFNFNGANLNKSGTYTSILKKGSSTGCDSTITLNLTVNETKKGTINREICSGQNLTENGQVYAQAGTYTQLLSKNASNGCDSALEINLKVIPNGILSLTLSVCEGGAYSWNGETFSATGNYQRLIPKASGKGCDSILNLNFTVNKVKTAQVVQTKCFGETYFFDGKNLNQSGTYIQTLKGGSVQGCDSITTLVLQILSKKSSVQTAFICEGETYFIGSTPYTTTGSFTQTLKTNIGCDSMVDLNLTVKPLSRANINSTICEGTFIVVGGRTFNSEGTYTQSIKNGAKNGCDSIITLTLKIAKQSISYQTEFICPGKSYTFFNRELTIPGKYKEILYGQNKEGCDSIIELELLLAPPLTREINVKICPNRTFIYRNVSYSTPSIYAIILPKAAEGGCDSLILIRLENHPDLTQKITANLCLGEKFQFKGKTYDKAGTYYERVNSASSLICDSLYIISVNYFQEAKSTLQKTICFGDSVKVNDISYSKAGSYFQKLPASSINGCDSTVQINISYFQIDTNRVTNYICNGDSLLVENTYFKNPGVYSLKYSLKNKNGCDSILKLTLLPSFKDSIFTKTQICSNDSILFGNKYYNKTGIYRYDAINQAGCKQLNELKLTVNNISSSRLDLLLCPGEKYAQWGNTFSNPGIYSIKLKNTLGCDSTITFNLTWRKSDTTVIQKTLCEGEILSLNNQVFTLSGTYFQQLKSTNTNGCDSTIKIILSVTPLANGTLNATFCKGKSFTLNGFNYTAPGTYSQKFPKASVTKCDSTLSIQLIELPGSVTNLKTEICWNDSVTIENKAYKVTGNYPITLQQKSANGCDSTVNLQLITKSQPLKNEIYTRCAGDTLLLYGERLFKNGTYAILKKGSVNPDCDTLVNVKISFTEPTPSQITLPLCPSDTITSWGRTFTKAGTYEVVLKNQSSTGCDSIINLTVKDALVNQSRKDTVICQGDTLKYNGYSYFNEGMYMQELKGRSASGCDSIIELNIKINGDASFYLEKYICPNDEFPFFETSVKTPGTYIKRFSGFSKNGCDSLVVLSLKNYTVLKDTLRKSICVGDTVKIKNYTFYESGVYTRTERRANQNGCDSTWTLILEVNEPDTGILSKIVCLGDTLQINETKYSASGDYTQLFPLGSSKGCDSLLTITIKTEPLKQVIEKAVLCYGEEIIWLNTRINTPGTYEKVFPNITQNGCDSTAIIEVNIYKEAILKFDTILKPNESFFFRNITYTDTGSYRLVLKNESFLGCDSIIQFKIIRDPRFCLETNAIDLSICYADSTKRSLNNLFTNKNNNRLNWVIKNRSNEKIDTIKDGFIPPNLAVGIYEIFQFPKLTDPCPRINYVLNVEILALPALNLREENILNCKDTVITINPSLNTDLYRFSWNTPDGFNKPKTSAEITTNLSGNYTLTVTENKTGCSISDKTKIIDEIKYPVIDAGINLNFLCDNINLKLNGNIENPTYSSTIFWTTPNGNIVKDAKTLRPEVSKTGTYLLSVTNTSNYCTSLDSVKVLPPTGEKIAAVANIIAPLCTDPNTGSILIESIKGGFPPYKVVLDDIESITRNFEKLKGGEHVLRITDDIGCIIDTVLLIKSPPDGLKISLGEDQRIFLGDSVQLPITKNIPTDWIKNIRWEADQKPFNCSACLQPTVNPVKTTTYKATLTDINGCEKSDIQLVYVDERGRIYAPTAFSPNGDGINDLFEIYADKSVENIEWMGIFDRWGTLVFEAKEFSPQTKGIGWDGTYLGKPLDAAVFVFAARVKLIQGDIKIIKGEIMLLR